MLIRQSKTESLFELIDFEKVNFKISRDKIKNTPLTASLPLIFKITNKRKLFFKTEDVFNLLIKEIKMQEENKRQEENKMQEAFIQQIEAKTLRT